MPSFELLDPIVPPAIQLAAAFASSCSGQSGKKLTYACKQMRAHIIVLLGPEHLPEFDAALRQYCTAPLP